MRNPDAVSVAQLEARSVEGLSAGLQRLVLERQALRSASASREVLEENRRAICRLQHQLSLALIARYQG